MVLGVVFLGDFETFTNQFDLGGRGSDSPFRLFVDQCSRTRRRGVAQFLERVAGARRGFGRQHEIQRNGKARFNADRFHPFKLNAPHERTKPGFHRAASQFVGNFAIRGKMMGQVLCMEWALQDSNLRPTACRAVALPTELNALRSLDNRDKGEVRQVPVIFAIGRAAGAAEGAYGAR